MMIVAIQSIRLRRDRLRQMIVDEQRCVFDEVFKENCFRRVIGSGGGVQTDVRCVDTHGETFEDEITSDPFMCTVFLFGSTF